MSFLSSGTMLTRTTPSIFRLPVTTCDAHELHISAEISSEISSVFAAADDAGALVVAGASAGEPHATATAASNNKKGAKRTFALCAWRPRSLVVRN